LSKQPKQVQRRRRAADRELRELRARVAVLEGELRERRQRDDQLVRRVAELEGELRERDDQHQRDDQRQRHEGRQRAIRRLTRRHRAIEKPGEAILAVLVKKYPKTVWAGHIKVPGIARQRLRTLGVLQELGFVESPRPRYWRARTRTACETFAVWLRDVLNPKLLR
jgi:hypothetical protein